MSEHPWPLSTPAEPHAALKVAAYAPLCASELSWLSTPPYENSLSWVSSSEADVLICRPQELSAVRRGAPKALIVALQAQNLPPNAPLSWGEGEARADDVLWPQPSPRELSAWLSRLHARLAERQRALSSEQRALALELASQSLTSAHSEALIFQRLVNIVAEQLHSDRVSLLSVEREQGVLQMRAAHGIPEHVVAQARPRIGEGIAGLCAERGEPIFISDHERFKAGKDQRGDQSEQSATDEPPRPMSLTVPLLTRGEVVGVVNVTGRANATPYSHQDIAFLSALMSHAGYLMESARLISNLSELKAFSDRVINTIEHPLVVLNMKGELLRENERFTTLYYKSEGAAPAPDEGTVQASPLNDMELLPTPVSVDEREMSPLLRWLSSQVSDLSISDELNEALRSTQAWRHTGWRCAGETFDLRLIPFEGCEGDNDSTAPHALLYFQDVTQRDQMQRQLVSAEKMASLGVLSAGVAHEINNPLGFVKTNTKEAGRYFEDLFEIIDAWHSYAQAHNTPQDAAPFEVEREVELDEVRTDAPTLVRESLDGLERMQKIIASLKSFAHPDTEQTREVQLSTLVEHALVITQGKWRHHLNITKDLPEHPPLSCIPNQLEQVFMNLVVNAAQAAQSRSQAMASMHVSLTSPAEGWVTLRFQDTCGGIPPDHLEKIFDPFFTTKDIGEGTGLGLHIAHNIIEGHGGELKVESDPPRGTTFAITLPLGQGGGPLVIKQLSRFKV